MRVDLRTPAGIEPGNILLGVNGKEIIPPEHPVFPMGSASTLEVVANDGTTRTVSAVVATPKGKKLQFIEPTLVQARRLTPEIGYLKVAMFPGMIGVDVANAMSQAVNELGDIRNLVVDLRGNTGGGAGALRLMSLLTPDRIPVGFSPNKQWASRDLELEKTRFPRFNRIPENKHLLWLLGVKFLPSLVTKSPGTPGERRARTEAVSRSHRSPGQSTHGKRRRDGHDFCEGKQACDCHWTEDGRPTFVCYFREGWTWVPSRPSHRRVLHLEFNGLGGHSSRS